MNKHFSVIIPALNEEIYLPICLDSLKKQDYSGQFEIIVVDNGSTDRTAEIARSFGVKVVEEKSRGVSRALRAGCEAAAGEILAFTDADAKLPADWLTKLGRSFEKFPEATAIGGSYIFYDMNPVFNFFVKKIGIPIATQINQKETYLPGVNMAVKKEFYDQCGGFNLEINWAQEIDICNRLRKFGRIIFDPKLVVSTSFRRYSGGHANIFLIIFHSIKEAIRTVGGFFLSAKYGRIFPAQKPLRPQPVSLVKKFVVNGLFVLVILFFYGLISPTTEVFGVTVSHGPEKENQKLIALTFDDGPYGEPTGRILDILKEKNVKATFFVVGRNAQKYPELLKREIVEGHVVGNHSFDHSKTLVLESSSRFMKNIDQADQAIASVTGLHPKFFRPPYGLKSPLMIGALHKRGYEVILWNKATDDYDRDQSAKSISEHILKKLKPGAIIDLHDGRDVKINYPRNNLVEALPEIIDQIQKAGYRPVTLEELLSEKPYF